MSKLRLTFACGPYDRTQALRDGTIAVDGVDLNYITMQPAEIFWRQLQYQEFDEVMDQVKRWNLDDFLKDKSYEGLAAR